MKRLLLLVLFILALQIVQADTFSVSHELLTPKVYPNSEAVFKITVKNDNSIQDTFTLLRDELASIPFSDKFEYSFIEPSTLTIPANGKKEAILKIKLLLQIAPNKYYKTFIIVKDSAGKEITHDILIPVSSPNEIIKITSSLPEKTAPGKELKFSLNFKNSLNIILDKIEIFISGDLIQDSFIQKFYPFQEIEKEFTLNLPSSKEQGFYKLDIKAFYKGEVKGSYTKTIRVVENPDIKEEVEKESSLFLKTIKVKKTNYGNTVIEGLYSLPVSKLDKLFLKTTPEPTFKKDSIYEWRFKINPDETYEIIINRDYRLLAVIIFSSLTIFILISYALNRRLIIKKAVFKVREEKGGIAELKVLLHIKNNGIPLKNVQLIDILPNLIKPTKDFGTLKPTRIQKGPSSLRLIWEISDFLTGDERIISYKVESHLHIVGKLILPRAIAKYKKGKNIVQVSSNRVIFLSLRNK